MRAKPTEYKGYMHRSKSEARFAVFLDQLTDGQYIYEPQCDWYPPDTDTNQPGRLSPYTPDFVTICPTDLTYVFIEYKPSEPAASYLEEIQWFSEFTPNCLMGESMLMCCWGTTYQNGRCETLTYFAEDCEWRTTADRWWIPGFTASWTQKCIEMSHNYRFDLKHPKVAP